MSNISYEIESEQPDKYKAPEIRLVDKNTPLGLIETIPWDAELNGVAYQICRIPTYYHTLGGTGDNNYWAYPYGELPSVDNIIMWEGDAPTWGIQFDRVNSIKCKWGETRLQCNGKATITRNGKFFYSFGARHIDYALAKGQALIIEFQEHPVPFHFRNWKDELVGRKMYYNSDPVIITNVVESRGCVTIVPDGIDKFTPPVWRDKDDIEEETSYLVDYLDKNIWWWRD